MKEIIARLEQQRNAIERALTALRELGDLPDSKSERSQTKLLVTSAKKHGPKRKMSAAGRQRISEATKKRWALKRAAEQAKPAKTKK